MECRIIDTSYTWELTATGWVYLVQTKWMFYWRNDNSYFYSEVGAQDFIKNNWWFCTWVYNVPFYITI